MLFHSIINLLGINEVIVLNQQESESLILIDVHLKNKRVKKYCNCGHVGLHKHDYRVQKIRDIPIRGKMTMIRLKRVRFRCPLCGKNHFVGPKKQWTHRLEKMVIRDSRVIISAKDITERYFISLTSYFRIIEQFEIQRKPLPHVLCIDEFKGDSGNEKYQCSLGDGENHELIDILSTRKKRATFIAISQRFHEKNVNVLKSLSLI